MEKGVSMAVTKAEVRSGAYYDSVVLMQLQRSLIALPGVVDAGVGVARRAWRFAAAHCP